ncbi:protein jagged-1-like [Ruditapes philippinarum]|uniref:protein jagged-1-like n=1 Tax=Ruditapes philippinarum TaxID=129788 RepID=UPI00295C11CA|nr:protein jagged-1-like [Ruditapes philippinarum]
MEHAFSYILIFISLLIVSDADESGCKSPKIYECNTHSDCTAHELIQHACVDKNGQKICMRCLCEDFSQCKWNKSGLFCECGGGFFGDHCECKSETSHCDPNPCVHGCCKEDGDSYSCQCKSGWEGQHCDTDINECLSSPCGVGYCIDELNKFKCECPKDYIDNCQGIDPLVVNLIIGYRQVTCSSVYNGHGPVKAVDGIIGNTYNLLYHSGKNDVKPWFRVKLIRKYYIGRIVLYNRKDQVCTTYYDRRKRTNPDCGARLRDLTIKVGENVCARYTRPPKNEQYIQIRCANKPYGDVITVMKDGVWLHFTEIQAFTN